MKPPPPPPPRSKAVAIAPAAVPASPLARAVTGALDLLKLTPKGVEGVFDAVVAHAVAASRLRAELEIERQTVMQLTRELAIERQHNLELRQARRPRPTVLSGPAGGIAIRTEPDKGGK